MKHQMLKNKYEWYASSLHRKVQRNIERNLNRCK